MLHNGQLFFGFGSERVSFKLYCPWYPVTFKRGKYVHKQSVQVRTNIGTSPLTPNCSCMNKQIFGVLTNKVFKYAQILILYFASYNKVLKYEHILWYFKFKYEQILILLWFSQKQKCSSMNTIDTWTLWPITFTETSHDCGNFRFSDWWEMFVGSMSQPDIRHPGNPHIWGTRLIGKVKPNQTGEAEQISEYHTLSQPKSCPPLTVNGATGIGCHWGSALWATSRKECCCLEASGTASSHGPRTCTCSILGSQLWSSELKSASWVLKSCFLHELPPFFAESSCLLFCFFFASFLVAPLLLILHSSRPPLFVLPACPPRLWPWSTKRWKGWKMMTMPCKQ